MTIEDKSQMPLFSPEDEKEAQKELKRLRKNENGVFKVNHKRTGFEDKTLWDWLQLVGILAIPLVVAGATLLFGVQQANLAQQQHDTDQTIANQQHDADQQRALDQQQATILQTYVDNIQDLLLNHNLLKSQPGENLAILARARTLTALQGLDPNRKGLLIQFLYEARLIGFLDKKDKVQDPIIDLTNANLSGANLSGLLLKGVYLRETDLSGADLSGAIINDANLSGTRLDSATLSSAILSGTDLSGASFYKTDLDVTDLSGADLTGVILTGVNLSGATLAGATLTGASISDTIISQQQLDQVSSCKGAALPLGLTCHHNQ